METELKGKRAVVVGGSSGMGFALCEKLLDLGCEVVMVSRSPARLAAARMQLQAHGALETRAADVTDEEQVRCLFEAAGPLDHLVCTAADIRGAYAMLPDLDRPALERAVASKVIAPILMAKHAAARIRAGGSITFVSGIAAYRPRPKGVAVAAINAALEGTVRALAVELAPLRVNAVSPGWVKTSIWEDVAGDETERLLASMAEKLPAGRIGLPGDIAHALLFLLANGYVTGSVLQVEGGHRLV